MKRLVGLLLATVLVPAAISPRAAAGERPTGLEQVPADALLFAHVRLADVWKSEQLKDLREVIRRAGDDLLAAYDKRFVPAPSSLDRLTVYVSKPPEGRPEPVIVVILTTTEPIDQQRLLDQYLPGAEKQQVKGKAVYRSPRRGEGVTFLGDRAVAFGPYQDVVHLLQSAPAREGPLAEPLKRARSGAAVVAAVDVAGLRALVPPNALRQIPPRFAPLLQAKLATLALDLGKQSRLTVQATYDDAQSAEAAEAAVKAGIGQARAFLKQATQELAQKVRGEGRPANLPDELVEATGALFAVGMLKKFDAWLADPPLAREQQTLRLAVDIPRELTPWTGASPVMIALLVPAVQKVRVAAARAQDQNNLKQIALAMHNYHDSYRGLPGAAICDKNGRPLLSWRVAILPFIEQQELYRRFKLDEPWDSEHNRKLIPLMPKLYEVPNVKSPPGETHYRVPYGNGALFDLCKKVRFIDVTDGTMNTLMVVTTAESVPWTKPDEVPYEPKGKLPRLARFFGDAGSSAAFADGSVRFLSPTVPEATLRALITRAGNEQVRDFD